jgi:hypothetical protein
MKKIYRLTETDLRNIIMESVNRILGEDVLGNNWDSNEDNEDYVFNNYDPFDDQERFKAEEDFRNQHDWGTEGEKQFDPTDENPYEDYEDSFHEGWSNYDPTDGELYHYR